ncbi:MAG: guanylate kinase [Chloroflexi bacterium]|nr:guanylate kinase [Chloroflexota bacterium]
MGAKSARNESSCPAVNSLLIVLSGPSGVGKDAVLSRMREIGSPLHFTITATTRAIRPSEQDGVDYIFLTHEEFHELKQSNGLLESAEVFGNSYGVPRSQVADALNGGQDVILKIDVQGAETIRRICPEALFIFLAPPNGGELKRRLLDRNTESEDEFELRMRTASSELQKADQFDYVVVNERDGLDKAVADIEAIISLEKRRVPARKVTLL